MLGIVIVTHGTLGEGLRNAAEVIIGAVENIAVVSLGNGDDIENLSTVVTSSIEEVNQEEGVLVFSDLIGASPYNQSILSVSRFAESLKDDVYVVAGASLPMLLEAINHQLLHTSIHDAIDKIVEAGKEGCGTWHYLQSSENSTIEDDDF